MSIAPYQLALHSEIDRFWQNADQRNEVSQGVDVAHTDTPMFSWGVLGTPLAMPQPHYRIFVPAPYLVVGWGMVADAVGNAIVKVEHAGYNPGGAVTFTDVTAGVPPSLTMQQAVITRRLKTWTPNKWGVFDLLHVYIFSTTGLQELTFQLFTRRIRRVGTQGKITGTTGVEIITSTGAPVVLANP